MTRTEKITVWGSTAVMSVSGVAIGWMEYMMTPADSFAVVNHPWQPWLLKVHILSAPVMVFGIGMITMRHIWPHFRNGLKKGRRSGIWSMLLTVPMVVSGYAIQIMTSANWLNVVGYVHLALGVAFAVGGAIHYVSTARKARNGRQVNQNTAEEQPALV